MYKNDSSLIIGLNFDFWVYNSEGQLNHSY